MKAILLFLVTLLSASAQIPPGVMQDLLGVASVQTATTFNPTNISGVAPVAYWIGDNWSSGTRTLKDIFTNSWNLTNDNSAWNPTSGTLNGHTIIKFGEGGNINGTLANQAFVSASPFEVVMVYRFNSSYPNATRYLFSNPDGSVYWALFAGGTGQHYLNNDGSHYFSIPANSLATNKWMVFNFVFNGASSAIYTNCATLAAGTAGTWSLTNFWLGGKAMGNGAYPADIAEIGVYSGTLGAGAWSANRSNLFNYLTNKYAITP